MSTLAGANVHMARLGAAVGPHARLWCCRLWRRDCARMNAAGDATFRAAGPA